MNGQLIDNMPDADYRAAAGLAFSKLVRIDQSPAHTTVSRKVTKAMDIGRIAHVCILECARFDSTYAPEPRGDKRTTAWKDAKKAAQEQSPNAELLPADDHDALICMRRAVYANANLQRILSAPHMTEASMFWTDQTTGLALKGRADWLSRRGVLIDLKTTEDASVEAFERSLATWDYFGQLAYYADGATACGIDVQHCLLIAVEKEQPFGVAVYQIDDSALDAGRAMNRWRLTRYAQCVKDNSWPGYPAHIQTIGLPAWKLKQIEHMKGVCG
jgi:exodeoxyribonuclease VIII